MPQLGCDTRHSGRFGSAGDETLPADTAGEREVQVRVVLRDRLVAQPYAVGGAQRDVLEAIPFLARAPKDEEPPVEEDVEP